MATVIVTLVYWAVATIVIGEFLYSSYLKYTLSQTYFWLILLGLTNPLTLGMVWGGLGSVRAAIKARKVECKHGVKGGETLGRCRLCLEMKAEVARDLMFQSVEKEKRDKIRKDAQTLVAGQAARYVEQNIKSLTHLRQINPRDFEDVIGEMYRRLGYQVKQTPYSNDKGKDLILKKNGKIYLVECKRYSEDNTVGREQLQKFFAAIYQESADMGFFVTTSTFKSTAIEYAKEMGRIELINGTQLAQMMRTAFPEKSQGEIFSLMCQECGKVVQFNYKDCDQPMHCPDGHIIANDFEKHVQSTYLVRTAPVCPDCKTSMRRVARSGRKPFWGCSSYPKCKRTKRY